MKNRFLKVFLLAFVVAVMFSVAVSAAHSGTCGENLTWTLDDEGTLTISGEGDMTGWGLYDNSPWDEYSSSITKIEIGNGVTSIIPGAFNSCSKINELVIPSGTKQLGVLSFTNKEELKVVLSEGVTHINVQAFDSIQKLTVVIPSTLQYIGGYTFARCPDVTIELSADNPYFTMVDGVLYTSDMKKLVYALPTLTGDFTVPSSVTSICDGAFVFSKLDSLIIPDTVTSMYDNADDPLLNADENYWGVSGRIFPNASIKNITIGKNIEYLADCCFYSCEGVESVTILNKNIEFNDNAILYCDGLTLYGYSGSTTETYAKENDIPFVPLEEQDFIPGDANSDGTVNNRDAARILQYVAGWDVEINLDAANVNGDTSVNNRDAARILQYIAGWDVTLD